MTSIGIFDSGFGGLSVTKQIIKKVPSASLVYLADSARCPYGVRTVAEIRKFMAEAANWFKAKDVDVLVLACNTATAAAYDVVKDLLGIDVIGVIAGGAKAAVSASKTGKIGVVATESTCNSGAYVKAIKSLNSSADVFQEASPRTVEYVESGLDDTSLINKIVMEDTLSLRSSGIDTCILGCTHFPLVEGAFESAFDSSVTLVDPAIETAKIVKDAVGTQCNFDDNTRYDFYTTSDNAKLFEFNIKRFLEIESSNIYINTKLGG